MCWHQKLLCENLPSFTLEHLHASALAPSSQPVLHFPFNLCHQWNECTVLSQRDCLTARGSSDVTTLDSFCSGQPLGGRLWPRTLPAASNPSYVRMQVAKPCTVSPASHLLTAQRQPSLGESIFTLLFVPALLLNPFLSKVCVLVEIVESEP